MPDVTIDLGQFFQLRRDIDRIPTGGGEPWDTMWIQWAARYRSFAQQRFDRYSRGGGDWPPLKPGTIRARLRATVTRTRFHNRRFRGEISPEGQAYNVVKAEKRARRELKRYQRGLKRFAILRDTGILFAALQPRFVGAPGQYQGKIPAGVRVGYGGPGRHPTDGRGSEATIAEIAMFHDTGAGLLPRREIIVGPDRQTIDGMESDFVRALKRSAGGIVK